MKSKSNAVELVESSIRRINRVVETCRKLGPLLDQFEQIFGVNGSVKRAKRKYAKREVMLPAKEFDRDRTVKRESLWQIAASVMGRNSMRAADIASAALKAGHKPTSQHFPGSLSVMLATDKHFQRVRKGLYRVKARYQL